MPNIVKLSARTARLAPSLQPGDHASDEIFLQLVNRVMELRARAHHEVQRVIVLLNLLLSNTRKITDQISNPGVRKSFENELVSIETKLKLVHEKALDLGSEEPQSRFSGLRNEGGGS